MSCFPAPPSSINLTLLLTRMFAGFTSVCLQHEMPRHRTHISSCSYCMPGYATHCPAKPALNTCPSPSCRLGGGHWLDPKCIHAARLWQCWDGSVEFLIWEWDLQGRHIQHVFLCPWLAALAQNHPKPPSPSGTSNCKFRFKPLGWSSSRTKSFQSVACEDVPCVGSGTTYNGRCIFSKCLKHPRSPSSSNPVSLMYRILRLHHPLFSWRSWSFFWMFGHFTFAQISGQVSRDTLKRSCNWTFRSAFSKWSSKVSCFFGMRLLRAQSRKWSSYSATLVGECFSVLTIWAMSMCWQVQDAWTVMLLVAWGHHLITSWLIGSYQSWFEPLDASRCALLGCQYASKSNLGSWFQCFQVQNDQEKWSQHKHNMSYLESVPNN